MRRLLILLTALAMGFGASPAVAQEAAAIGPSTLTVEGQATVTRSPEIATVSVGITTNDPSATTAQSQNNTSYNAVKAALAKLGIGESAIKTTSYSMNYTPPPQPEQGASTAHGYPGQRFGYVVSRNLNVTTSPNNVGAVVDACSAAGASDVGGISFDVRDRRAASVAAMSAAIADADAQAHALAAGGHFHIVRLRSIQTGSRAYAPAPMMMAKAAAPATDIPASNVEFNASVTVTYVISQ